MGRADPVAFTREAGQSVFAVVLCRLRDAKIQDFGLASSSLGPAAQEYVVRLEVAVNDADIVGGLDAAKHRKHEPDEIRRSLRPF